MHHQRLRIGIAGTGFIGAVHARSARLAGARLAGVAAATPALGQEAADALGADRAFPSAEALVEAPGIDVVHICTPNHLHVPLAQAALAAGKHVICEKPLAVDVAGATALAAAAAEAAAGNAVPFVYRFYPTVRELRERVRRGDTGAIRLLHGSYLQDWLLRADDYNWRVEAVLGGASRAFADIGSHWCDLAEFVSGQRITRVSARTLVAIPERAEDTRRRSFERAPRVSGMAGARRVTTEDAALVQFETDGSAMGSVLVSQISPGRKNRLWIELDCAEEALVFDQEAPETLWCGRRETTTIFRRDPQTLSPDAARLAVLPGGHPQGYAHCFEAFVADVYEAIRSGTVRDGLPQFADGLRAAQITEAVLRSARDEAWVAVAPATGTASALAGVGS
jgi:predicted dehydrogenase